MRLCRIPSALLVGGAVLGLSFAACEETVSREGEPGSSAESQAAPTSPAPPPAPEELTEVDAAALPDVLASRRGRATLVNVWSTWCAPCMEEMPMLIDTFERYEARGLALVLISADGPAQRGSALVFLRAEGAPFPSYVKTGSEDRFIGAFHPDWSGALPATILLDGEGAVKEFWEGPLVRERITPPIEQLLAQSAG